MLHPKLHRQDARGLSRNAIAKARKIASDVSGVPTNGIGKKGANRRKIARMPMMQSCAINQPNNNPRHLANNSASSR